jgi:hypothetical protein
MAVTKFKKRDLNRIKKVYPYIRKKPIWGLLSDKEVVIEAAAVTFTSATSSQYYFDGTYDSAPVITAIAIDSESNNQANVNIWVESVDKLSVTFGSSQTFTGKVHFHAIMIKD